MKYLSRFLNSFQTELSHHRSCYVPVKRAVLDNLKDDPHLSSTEVSLSSHLSSKIKATGPIPIADYMKEVLTNPGKGYYMHRDVFGKEGDFITSPEISQMFGELVAIWCINECKNITAKKPMQIIELGPGRGTLAYDLLRVMHHFGFSKEISLHLVEISPHLSALQSRKLCMTSSPSFGSNTAYYRCGETPNGVQVFWYPSLKDVPRQFSVVFAHEFFDALPIHKFQKTLDGWREVLVDLDLKNTDKFRYVLSRNETPATKLFQIDPKETRHHIEIRPSANLIIEELCTRFSEEGGFALIADYGHDGDKEDTFRAFKKHKLHEPLDDPGSADITADVDFSQLRKTALSQKKSITFGPINQTDFLLNMGIDLRLKMLIKKTAPEYIELLKKGYDMMVDKDKMGSRFKFFCIFPESLRTHFDDSPISGFSSPYIEQ